MIVNNCHADVYKWIESTIDSCTSYKQTLVADKLIDQFEIMYGNKLPIYIVNDLAKILRRKVADKWVSYGIVAN